MNDLILTRGQVESLAALATVISPDHGYVRIRAGAGQVIADAAAPFRVGRVAFDIADADLGAEYLVPAAAMRHVARSARSERATRAMPVVTLSTRADGSTAAEYPAGGAMSSAVWTRPGVALVNLDRILPSATATLHPADGVRLDLRLIDDIRRIPHPDDAGPVDRHVWQLRTIQASPVPQVYATRPHPVHEGAHAVEVLALALPA
jgi:hypothetical protein